MADPEDCRVFVGGLSWDTSDKRLEQAFRRFGKVLDAKVMIDKDTGRPRGFGFVTFGDEQSMEDAIAGLHNGELDGRIISVSKAQSKLMGGAGRDYGYEDSYDNGGGRGGYYRGGGGGGRGGGGGGSDDCFKCGKPGHWARDCPHGRGDGGRFSDGGRFPPRYGGGGGGGRPERFGGGGPSSFGGGGKYGGDDRYGGRERFGSGRYSDGGGYGSGYGGGYGRGGRGGGGGGGGGGGYDRGGDRYGSGGPVRYDRGFKDRPAPYGGRPSGRPSYDDRY